MLVNRKDIFMFIGFCLFFAIGLYLSERYHNNRVELLNGPTSRTSAIISNKYVEIHTGPVIVIRFEVNSVVNEIRYIKKYDYLEKGDTILIKYSVEDPTVIEVVDPCFMQKHKGKPYCK